MTEQNRDIQRKLRELGLYPGMIDGELGATTVAAIEKFQTAHGLAATGKLNATVRTLLLEDTRNLSTDDDDQPTEVKPAD